MIEFINLKNKNQASLIRDVLLYPLKVNRDETGILVETLRNDWQLIYGEGREFSMQYFSVTQSGVARDETVWHSHPTQEDRFIVASGEIITAVADNRHNSPTLGMLNLFNMKAEIDPFILLIPRETLHGFMVVSQSPAVLLNFPTQLYNPHEEKRIDYEKTDVKFPSGTPFSWNEVRKEFKIPLSK